MIEIISVRFKSEGKQYYFNPQGMQVAPGDGVIVETSRGIEFGECVQGNTEIDEIELVAPLRPVVRLATEQDYATVRQNKEKEKEAFGICQEKIQEHELDMKLVDVEYSFEGNKILFFFTSEGRVDFRALVKDLASVFHTRIELRQIGVRDEAKMLGGLGICGKPFCCATFLSEFQPVSIKMAKTQNLSLNPTKISGTCGRLMCCLKYEQEAYEHLLKGSPKMDSFVETPDGAGTVIGVNILREQARVRLDDTPDSPKTYHNTEIRVVRSGKGKRPEGYEPPPAEELAKLRREVPKQEEPAEEDAFRAAVSAYLKESDQETQSAPRPERTRRNDRPRSEKKEEPRERPEKESAPQAGKGGGRQNRGEKRRSGRGEKPAQSKDGQPANPKPQKKMSASEKAAVHAADAAEQPEKEATAPPAGEAGAARTDEKKRRYWRRRSSRRKNNEKPKE